MNDMVNRLLGTAIGASFGYVDLIICNSNLAAICVTFFIYVFLVTFVRSGQRFPYVGFVASFTPVQYFNNIWRFMNAYDF